MHELTNILEKYTDSKAAALTGAAFIVVDSNGMMHISPYTYSHYTLLHLSMLFTTSRPAVLLVIKIAK
jgi:hypothetical protein